MNMKINVCALTAACSLLAGAEGVPEVSKVTMAQNSATREVTITYKLENAPAVITLDITTNGVSIGGENIQNFSADSEVWKRVETNGTYTIKWHPDLSWPDHKITLEQGGVKAVVKAWALDNTPDYMVVDLTAAPNTQKYYPGEAYLPGGILGNDEYSTSKLVMRKIMAKNVSWTMGSTTEPGRGAGTEIPHQVVLTNNYYIGVFEITQTQLELIGMRNPSQFNMAGESRKRPADGLCYVELRLGSNYYYTSEDDANRHRWPADPAEDSFLGKLRAKTGLDFDLPNEGQWEFACRAGHGEGYWNDGMSMNGQDNDPNLKARYFYNGGSDPQGNEIPAEHAQWYGVTNGTAAVGTSDRNSWGLYDMHGNVYEICLDNYEDDCSLAVNGCNINPSNPLQTLSGKSADSAVYRGGCYVKFATACRSAVRAGCDFRSTCYNSRWGARVACRAGLK